MVAASGGGDTTGNSNDGADTPQDWDQPWDGDVRSTQGTGEYPNYWSHKTRSGHNFIMDDSKGSESVTIQHRSGTAIQMQPDGALHITAHNSKYEVTFGEHRMTISGAQDITVKGDASMRVYGNLNTTVHKDYNLSVQGDFNITAKNFNRHIRGNMDTMAKNETKKFEGSSGVTAHGGIARVAKGSITMASQQDQAHVVGATGVNVKVPVKGNINVFNEDGNMNMETKNGKLDGKFVQEGQKVSMLLEKGNCHVQSQNETNVKSETNKITMECLRDMNFKSTAGGIKSQALVGNIQNIAGTNIQSTAQQSVETTATSGSLKMAAPSGKALLTGLAAALTGTADAHVSAPMVNVKGDAMTSVDGGMLNLNGGLSQLMGLIPGLQLAFDFGNIQQAIGAVVPQAIRADQPQQEQDSSSFWQNIH